MNFTVETVTMSGLSWKWQCTVIQTVVPFGLTTLNLVN